MNLKFYETTFNLLSSDKTLVINQFAPLNFIVNPFDARPLSNQDTETGQGQFKFESKIYKIVYDWGDGVTETQKIEPSSFNSSASLVYPIQKETGDPRNFSKNHIYNLIDTFKRVINGNVKIYMFGVKNPLVYKFRVILNAPKLDGSKTGFFKNFHLINSKIFGPDNKILYIFEGKDPSWVFPVIAEWRPKSGQESAILIEDYNTYQLNI
jgi:hypothetical protein